MFAGWELEAAALMCSSSAPESHAVTTDSKDNRAFRARRQRKGGEKRLTLSLLVPYCPTRFPFLAWSLPRLVCTNGGCLLLKTQAVACARVVLGSCRRVVLPGLMHMAYGIATSAILIRLPSY